MAKTTDNTSSAVLPFLFQGDGLVRVITREGEPWFVATDVCRAIGIKQATRAVEALDNDEKWVTSTHPFFDEKALWLISESGLYTLILRSRAATTPGTVQHRFRKWVTSEVLPTIRKTGGYRAARQGLTEEERAARAEQRRFNNEMRERGTRINEARQSLAERALHVRAVSETRLTKGRLAAQTLIPGLLRAWGVDPATVPSEPQGELPLDDDDNGSMH